MTTTKQYDELNRLSTINSSSSSFSYQYNPANQRTKDTLADGSYWIYGYDSLGQVTNGSKFFANGTPVAGQQFDYTFDTIGNRTLTMSGGDINGANLRVANYTNNTLNQIIGRDVPPYMDVMGASLLTNLVTVNGQTAYRNQEYFRQQLPANNAVSALWTNIVVSGGQNVTGNVYVAREPEVFSYDPDGNLTNDGRWAYAWDAENRLIGMTVNTNVGPYYQLSFAYDSKGRRIQKSVVSNSVALYTTDFLYDGWNLIAELSTSHSALRTYVWGTDLSGSPQGAGGVGGLLEASYNGTSTTNCFSAFDGNGNIAALVNAADGTSLANYEYGPFGEVVRATGPMAKLNPIRFSTKYQDDESDLLNYGYRYYKASTGDWLSRDPLTELGFSLLVTGEQASLGDDDDSPNLNDFLTAGGPNIYDFIQNNGVNFADHLGLFLAAIDGTDSKLWVGQKHRNSFVKNFYNSYVAAGGNAKYWDGPKTLGGGVARTVTDVYNAICAAKAANPSEQIDLVGHSRGGLIAILVAKRLQEHPCGSCGVNEFVRFMGLYDAVGMYLWASPSTISRNVVYVAHARRDPADGSRPNWGNVGTSGGMTYVQQFFWCTHSGMGGDPWGGDHPPQMTQQEDDENSPKVDAWIRQNARDRGLQGL